MTYAELLKEIDDEIKDIDFVLDNGIPSGGSPEADLDLANQIRYEAESLAAAGLIDDAKRRLECFLFPVWPSAECCEDHYREAMGR